MLGCVLESLPDFFERVPFNFFCDCRSYISAAVVRSSAHTWHTHHHNEGARGHQKEGAHTRRLRGVFDGAPRVLFLIPIQLLIVGLLFRHTHLELVALLALACHVAHR